MDLKKELELLNEADLKVSSGYFEIDLLNESVLLTKEIYQILGLSPNQRLTTIEELGKFIHPEDVERFFSHYYKTISDCSNMEQICRVIDNKGYGKIIFISGQVQFDKKWGIKKFFGSILDMSPVFTLKMRLHNEEEKYKNLVENAPVGIGMAYKDRFVYANKIMIEIFGRDSLKELKQKSIVDYTHPDDRTKLLNFINMIKNEEAGIPVKLSNRIVWDNRNIRYLDIYITKSHHYNKNYRQAIVLDVTEKMKLSEEHRKLAADALYINQQKKILSEIKTELDTVLDKKPVYHKKDFQKIYGIIESYSKLDKDWNVLISHFEKIYSGFFKRLRVDFPTLSPNDLKHCACIKMNFNTKETARFFNVKISSVQIARVRIKKKMKLPQHIDLKIYILNY